MLRFALVILLAGFLLASSTLLHILSTTYIFGVLSGLLLGAALWMKWRKPKPEQRGARHGIEGTQSQAAGRKAD